MGVPAFFRWLCRKYPSIVMQCAEEKPKQNVVTNEKIPVDTSQPNPSGIEFDNLYLDMNGIIHPCTHPEDRPAPKNEDEMMVIIFEFIDRIFSIVRPRKLLYMAIDGVAPRAKMNQQRSRRFRAAKDNSEKANEIKRLKDQIISNGGTVPPEVPQSEKFDSNCITPGTPFMHKLADCLRYYIHDRLNNDPGWKNICVILSDANVPGEGEHKIMDYIRRQRAQPDHDPNTHHVLCGADADLIMLGLATHEPHFSIIREEFKPDKPRPCEICNQFGHDTKECTGLTREKSGAHDEMANSFTPSEQQYIFLRLSILREYLNKELFLPNLPFKFDIERAIDDWVFMCFFVGNDFLPHLPSLEIRENAIDRLVNLYKNMINEAGGYLTDCGDVNLSRVQFILTGIGEVEDDIFKKRQRNEAEFKQRQKEKKKRMRMGQDLPSHMPSWMKSGPYAPTPLGKKVNPIKTDNKFEKLEMKEVIEVETIILNTETDADDEEKRGIKRKHPIEAANDATTSKLEPDPEPKRKPSETEATEPEVVEIEKVLPEEEEEDDESNDPVRLWEDGWKQRYYKVKFDVSEDDIDFRRKVARHYAIGLQWVLKYYYQGVPSWGWYFPYHYAPFASDFVDINDAITDFDIPSQPFNPFEQLMAVFPAASKKHVPEQWQILMTDPESSIIDFYPEDFAIDLNGKKQSWQGVALLPFVDEKRLMKAIEPLYEKLDAEQRKRNTRGNDRIFVRKSHSLYDSLKDLYNQTDMDKKYRKLKEAIDIETSISSGIAGKVWCDEYVVLENEVVRSPLRFCCPDLMHNQVVSVHYHDPMYDAEYVFNTLILEGAIIPDPTLKPEDFDNNNRYRPNLGFNRNNDYRNNKNPSVANRMIQNSMNSEMMSSAFTGQNSVYGAYKTSASFSTYSNNNQQQQNRGGYNNNNYNNNGRNYNNNRNNYNNNYNNNQGGGGVAGNSGGNYNNNYNNNVGTGGGGGNNGGGNNYNNNSRNGNYNNNNNYRNNNNNNNGGYNNRNNYNNNNNANNTNQRFPDNVNNNNFQANTGNNVNNGNPSNSNQQRQYNNRQQTTNPK